MTPAECAAAFLMSRMILSPAKVGETAGAVSVGSKMGDPDGNPSSGPEIAAGLRNADGFPKGRLGSAR